jgi:GH43 family beta-xylosidase
MGEMGGITMVLIPYYLMPDTVLPSEIDGRPVVWQATLPGALGADGKLISRAEEMSPEFRLTASALDCEYAFTARMLGADSQWLAGYTREPDGNPNVRSMFVASSLHLALGAGAGGWEALNSNYGVLFASADYSDTPAGKTRHLRTPRLFRLAGSGFGILATSLDYEGTEDRPGELLYFETQDFVRYEEKGSIKLTEAALLDYSCELDASTLSYRIGWVEEGGEAYFATTADFITVDSPAPGAGFPIRAVNLDIPDARPGQRIALTAAEAAYVRNKLGRVRNVGVDAPVVTLRAGEALDLTKARLTVRYSDGSVGYKAIEADDPAELAALDLTQPGEYAIRVKAVRRTWPYPMMIARADPQIARYKGRYYFIATDEHGQRKIYIRSADTLEGLEDGQAEETLLWDGFIPDGERHGQHWAPELHIIEDKLYCFLAISVNNEWHGVQAHVARLGGDDPLNPEHWETPVRVVDRHGRYLSDLAEREFNISLDMTYFEHSGQAYVCWSQPRWFGELQERASLYIATVNPEQPWRLTSDPVRICRNEYGWDRDGGIASGVAEGPYVLKHGDRIYMVYSGSNVGPRYTVGMLELDAADDPLNPAAWRKANYPWMHSSSLPGQYGPGHNSFVQDESGAWYNVYHACGVDGGHRHAAIRPVHFRFDGSPVLDMRDEEELLPQYERITLTIVVE